MSQTEVTDYTFTVKEGHPPEEGGEAPVWLMCEPDTEELSIVGDNGFLGIRLKPGVNLDEARKIARFFRENVVGISHTSL